MTNKIKYCKNCQYFKLKYSNLFLLLLPFTWIFYKLIKENSIRFGKCSKFSFNDVSYYVGSDYYKKFHYASLQRSETGNCGYGGKYYKEKQNKNCIEKLLLK